MKAADIPLDEQDRIATLQEYQILDTLPEQVYDDLTRLAAHICETPIALVSLVDTDRQWFKSRVGLDAAETPRELAFCAHAILEDQLLVIPDASADERFADNPLVVSGPNVKFYAGAPLVTPSGHAIGTLCVIDQKARTLKPAQLGMLEALGRQVVSQLELRLGSIRQEEARAEIEAAMTEAQAANRAKSTFLANMSHELRTPLNSVIGFTQVLRRDVPEGGDQERYLGRILSNGKHLLALINEILDLSKIEAGRIDLDIQPVALDGLIRAVCEGLEEAISSHGVDFRIDLPPGLDPIEADRLRLEETLTNLIANAIRFAAHGIVEVRVIAEGKKPTRIDVADSGIGIAPEKLEKIFDSFVQADSSTSRRFGGTGLGLSISRALCRVMGFQLVVDSIKGEGATFSIMLDARAAKAVHAKPE